MDPFAVVLLFGFVALILVVLALGKYVPGSGLEQLGLRSARQITETRESLEAEDLDQMMRAHNRRRRARGQDEVSVGEVELRVAEDIREQRRRSAQYLAERDLGQLLDTTNERRRRRGLPERSPEEAREEFGAGRSGGEASTAGDLGAASPGKEGGAGRRREEPPPGSADTPED